MLEVNALCAGYGGRAVVREVTFSVEEGEILTLVGPNGSGKSTLLKTVAGPLAPVSGEVTVNGVPISRMSRKFIKHPLEAVSVGDVVEVQVLDVDLQRKRISLTMLIDR